MAHLVGADVAHLCSAHTDRGGLQGSGKVGLDDSARVPVFVRKAVELGYSCEAASALYQRIAQTRADIRARRITPAGGVRRVERLAIAVDVARTVLR